MRTRCSSEPRQANRPACGHSAALSNLRQSAKSAEKMRVSICGLAWRLPTAPPAILGHFRLFHPGTGYFRLHKKIVFLGGILIQSRGQFFLFTNSKSFESGRKIRPASMSHPPDENARPFSVWPWPVFSSSRLFFALFSPTQPTQPIQCYPPGASCALLIPYENEMFQ